jgi:hypothetical protein
MVKQILPDIPTIHAHHRTLSFAIPGVSDVLVHSLSNDHTPYFLSGTGRSRIVCISPMYIVVHRTVKVERRNDEYSLQVFSVNAKLLCEIFTPAHFNTLR